MKSAETGFSSRLYEAQMGECRKTLTPWRLTALPIFKRQLDIFIHICVHDKYFKGKIWVISKEATSLNMPMYFLSAVFFFFFKSNAQAVRSPLVTEVCIGEGW